jgi:hypothetical protein
VNLKGKHASALYRQVPFIKRFAILSGFFSHIQCLLVLSSLFITPRFSQVKELEVSRKEMVVLDIS